MRHHVLTDTAFGALGAGRPDAATLRELRRAQIGKHLLLLREIVRAVPGKTPPWYDRMAGADPEEARRTLADPLFGVWATHCLRSLRAGHSPETAGVDHLPVQSPGRELTAVHDGLTLRVRLEDSNPLRARLGLTPTGRLTAAEVRHWQTCLTDAWRILAGRHRPAAEILAEVVSCLVPVEPDPAARGISATSADAFGAVAMSAPEDGVSLAVGLLHEAQHSVLNATQYLFDLHQAPNELGYSPWRDDPRPASGILHGAYAYLAVTRFWRTEAQHGGNEPGDTKGDGREPSGNSQVGETKNGDRESSAEVGPGGDPLVAFEFARWRAAVAETAGRLLDQGNLTAAGTRFVTALRDEVSPWLNEPPFPAYERRSDDTSGVGEADAAKAAGHRPRPSDSPRCSEQGQSSDSPGCSEQRPSGDSSRCSEQRPSGDSPGCSEQRPGSDDPGCSEQRLAEIANLDHYLRWRLRNLAVDLSTGTSRLVPAPKRALESSDRLDLIHRTLSGRQPGGRATAADTALLRGCHGTAGHAYRKMILENPADDAAWTGLAIATGRLDRLEVLVAAYRARDDRPDPLAWISG